MAGWCWFPAKDSSAPRLSRKQPQGHVRQRSIHPPIQQGCSLAVGARPFGAELLNRLDVSKYYVIRTIIISNTSVEGYGVLELLREGVRYRAVAQGELQCQELRSGGRTPLPFGDALASG